MLLPELYNIIFELSNNKELNVLNQVCKCFNDETTNILTKRRLNYPRINKHVKHIVPFTLECLLPLTLKYLYNSGVDLVKGDIVVSFAIENKTDYQAIYNGEKLVRYYYQWFEPIELDESLDIVKNNVPFDYWDMLFEIFHIDLGPYMETCINNIKYDLLSNIVNDYHPSYKNLYVLYTHFTINTTNKTYYIILEDDNNYNIKNLEIQKSFKKELQNFYCNIDSDYGSNTLIMTL